MSKNKKIFALVAVVILLIIFVGVISIRMTPLSNKEMESNLPLLSPAANSEPSTAVQPEDGSACNKMPEQSLRAGCYLNAAETKRDPSVCDNIPDPDQRNTCHLAVAAAGQDPSSRPKPPNPALLFSKWKIFTNEKQKYSFRHPPEWIFRVTFSHPETDKLHVIRETTSNRNDCNWNWSMQISAWDNPGNLSLIDWLKSLKEPGGFISKDMPFRPNTAVGKAKAEALQTWVGGKTTTWDKPGECFQSCPSLFVYFAHKDKGYRVELEGADAPKKESQEILRQIVSTFEFID